MGGDAGQSVVLYDSEVCLGRRRNYLGTCGTVSAKAGRAMSFS